MPSTVQMISICTEYGSSLIIIIIIIINTYLKWVACNNQHKSQFFTAGPTIKRIDEIYYIIQVGTTEIGKNR